MADADKKICSKCRELKPLSAFTSHETSKVRQILYTNCNLGLGHFMDDPQRPRAAADCLEAHGA